MVDESGKPIAYKPEMKSSYDATTGTLVQYDDFGNFKATQISQ
jgi:hypothetical protein